MLRNGCRLAIIPLASCDNDNGLKYLGNLTKLPNESRQHAKKRNFIQDKFLKIFYSKKKIYK